MKQVFLIKIKRVAEATPYDGNECYSTSAMKSGLSCI